MTRVMCDGFVGPSENGPWTPCPKEAVWGMGAAFRNYCADHSPPPGTFPPQCHTLAPGPPLDGWASIENEDRLA